MREEQEAGGEDRWEGLTSKQARTDFWTVALLGHKQR